MNVEIASALYRYFEALYELNQNIMVLCGIDVLDNRGEYEKNIENVIHLVPKLVPYKYDKRKKSYKLENGDGLLEFESSMPFLRTDYEHILQCHYACLSDIKTIRNKLEHRLHGVNINSSGSGSFCLFEMTYQVDEKNIRITAGELIGLVRELNVLFAKIQEQVAAFAYQNDKFPYPYYRKITRFSFENFNQIYECNLLRIFGKALLPF